MDVADVLIEEAEWASPLEHQDGLKVVTGDMASL